MRERGHTLVEVLVTAILVAILGIVFGLAGRFMSGETVKLRKRARAVSELRMAVEYLRQDLARAQSAQAITDGGLRIVPEDPIADLEPPIDPATDRTIEYITSEGRLIRQDAGTETDTVVAVNLAAFDVDHPDGIQTRIYLSAGEGDLTRAVTLIWEP